MEVDIPTPAPTQNNELIQVEQKNDELMARQNNEQVPVEQQNNKQVPIEQQKNEPVPVEQQKNEPVPIEQQNKELMPVEQQDNEQVTIEQQKNEPVPVEQQVRVEQPKNEQVPIEKQSIKPVPMEQQNDEPVPIEQQNDEPVPIEQQNNEQVPVEQQNNEPAPIEQQNNEPAPIEQQNDEQVPVEQEKNELVPMEQQNDEKVPVEQQNSELVPMEPQNDEQVQVEQQNSELVPMEQPSNEQVPIEQENKEQVPIEHNELVPAEEQNKEQIPIEHNELVPVEEQNNEQVPIEQQNNEPSPMEQQNNEQVPVGQQKNELVIVGQQNSELVPVEQPNNEQVPIEKQSNEPIPMEQQNEEQVPIEQKNNELVPVEQPNDEQVPIEQQNIEQVPIEQQNNEPVPMEQENNEQVPVEQQKNELLPVEQRSNELLPMENNELVLVVQQNNEIVVMEEQSNEQIPIEQQNNEPVPVEDEQNNQPVQVEDEQNNELVVMEEQSNEQNPIEQQNNEPVPLEEQQNNELIPMEHENNEQVPVEQQKKELLPVEQRGSELLPMEQQSNELLPMVHQNNELVLMEEHSNEQIPLGQQINELVPVEHQATELVPMEQSQPSNEPQPKRRKKSSIVWEHFTIEHVGAGCRRAYCKQCKQSFAYSTGSKVAGTSHLKRHIAKGACPLVLRQQNGQSTPLSAPSKMGAYSDTPKRRFRTPQTSYFSFNPDHCRQEISKMMLMHDYPLHMVEHSGFVSFSHSLQPRFDMVSFNTVQGDCVATYLREKQKLQKIIEAIPGRICLTLDMWSSSRTVGYVVLTGQFIDSDWKLQSKILNVVMEPYPESNTAFSHAVGACLSDWSLEGKLFSVTINQPLSDASVDNLRALLSVKNPLVLGGQLLIGNCLARTLSNIAQDALTSVSGTVKKIRDNVKYVKTSESLEDKFLQLKQQLQVPSSKVLALDDHTRWNTTYDMLVAAAELKEVFFCLDTSDPDFKIVPSTEDWKQVETLCAYLNPLVDTANILASPTVPTTNTFFHEAWKIQLELSRAAASDDSFVSNLTKAMQEKFDNYWKSCCFILATAVVMDPRFKMKLVEFSFRKIYGEEKAPDYVKIVDEGIHELFNEYASLPSDLMQIDSVNNGAHKPEDRQGGDSAVENGVGLLDFDMFMKQTNSQHPKSELDQYLEESLLPRVHEFDVVGWWRFNKEKYPTLSKMARDILSVPVCSVAPESVFDTVKKEMDPYRCSLRPETVEALICAKDWIQSHSEEDSKAIAKMELPI